MRVGQGVGLVGQEVAGQEGIVRRGLVRYRLCVTGRTITQKYPHSPHYTKHDSIHLLCKT